MQEFYFHPILGLQYLYNHINTDILIDLNSMPKAPSVDELLKLYSQQGIVFFNSSITEPISFITSNF